MNDTYAVFCLNQQIVKFVLQSVECEEYAIESFFMPDFISFIADVFVLIIPTFIINFEKY